MAEMTPWWEAIEQCRGMVGKGPKRRRCKKKAMRPYEVEKGNLIVSLYCHRHQIDWTREDAVAKALARSPKEA